MDRWTSITEEHLYNNHILTGVIMGVIFFVIVAICLFIWTKTKKGKSVIKKIKLNFAPDIQNQQLEEQQANGILSIITNFGCHYECPYCIVKNNHLNIPKTTLNGLDNLQRIINLYKFKEVSISGGGDPLYNYLQHRDWYNKLYSLQDLCQFKLELHTSYTTLPNNFPIERYNRVVYHIRYEDYMETLIKLKRLYTEIVRVVFVVTEQYTEADIRRIADFVRSSLEIDELSFRQMVDNTYQNRYYLHNFLKEGHKRDWWYIEQADYNIYYAENRVYKSYRELGGLYTH